MVELQNEVGDPLFFFRPAKLSMIIIVESPLFRKQQFFTKIQHICI
jgi:hypothetical protein